MNIDFQEAKRLIMLAVKNNPSGIGHPSIDRMFVREMPDMIIGFGNHLMPLIQQMKEDRIIQDNDFGYIKGSNFPKDF